MKVFYISIKQYFGLFVTIVFSLLSVGCKHQMADPQVSAGNLDTYPLFHSQFIEARTVRVWTPTDYDSTQLYEVLYMHDGQMLFDSRVSWNKQEWGIDEALDTLIRFGKVRPCIVVGIDNTENRIGEFCPDDIVQYLPKGKSVYNGIEAQGNNYLRFLVEELKPFIDSTYHVYTDAEHTWIMGSSCGGLISSYALCKYPYIFGGAACLSTHCTLAYPIPQQPDTDVVNAYRRYMVEHLPQVNSRLLYMDNGDETLDAFYVETQNKINASLQTAGWDEEHFMYRFFPGAAHKEDDWKVRLDIPLTFLLHTSQLE